MVTGHRYEIDYDKPSDNIRLAWLGDIHAGNKGCDKKKFTRQVEWVKAYCDVWIGMGDWADAIVNSDRKRFNWKSLDRNLFTPDIQYRWIKDQLEPIADTCATLMTGNHDYALEQYHQHDYVTELAEDLDILDYKMPVDKDDDGLYAQCAGIVRFQFNRRNAKQRRRFDVFCHHGKSASRTLGGKLNAIGHLSKIYRNAEIYAMGHTHVAHAFYEPYIDLDRNMNIIEKRKYFVLTGGFLKGWEKNIENYVQKGVMAPANLGGMFATIRPEMDRLPYITINEIPV